jgi:serine/threonine protein kinase
LSQVQAALEQARDLGLTLAAGAVLDRYELLCPIGRGGMAGVWAARLRGKLGFERIVAVKTILPQFGGDPRMRRMFVDEARVACRIVHPNVARVLDLGEERGVLYLVMEWVDGESLSKLQRVIQGRGGRVPVGVALRLVADACSGVHEAHELRDPEGAPLGVVHRDVSPQNLLVDVHGTCRVIDFGIAKARDRLSGDTSDGSLKGKVPYMSPEQARGLPVDRRADVWSLGAVLYHLLTGRPPVAGVNEAETLLQLTTCAKPAAFDDRVPQPVAEAVFGALAPLDERYPDAAEMRAALEAAMSECGLITSVADVAAYVGEHLAEERAGRVATIQGALGAAEDRRRSPAAADQELPATKAESSPDASGLRRMSRAKPRKGVLVAAAASVLTLGLALGASRWTHPRLASAGPTAMVTTPAATVVEQDEMLARWLPPAASASAAPQPGAAEPARAHGIRGHRASGTTDRMSGAKTRKPQQADYGF